MESITFVLGDKQTAHTTRQSFNHPQTYILDFTAMLLRKVKNGLIAFNYVRRAFRELTETSFLAHHLYCAAFFTFIPFVGYIRHSLVPM